MAFADGSPRAVIWGSVPIEITLGEAVSEGDLLGCASGWKRADGNNAIPAELIAAEAGASGERISAYPMALIRGFSGGTAGNPVYLSDTAGGYSDSVGSDVQMVGQMANATDALVRPLGRQFLKRVGIQIVLIDGGAAGDHTVTGIAVGDNLIRVLHTSTKAAIATMADLTSEFTVAADKINNTAGTDTSDDQLLVFYNRLT